MNFIYFCVYVRDALKQMEGVDFALSPDDAYVGRLHTFIGFKLRFYILLYGCV